MLHPGIDDLHCGPPEPLGTRQYVQRRMPFFAALRKASLTAPARVRGFRGNPPGTPGSAATGRLRTVPARRPERVAGRRPAAPGQAPAPRAMPAAWLPAPDGG